MNDTYRIVSETITEVLGVEADEITLDASLEEDLGIDMVEAFPRIIKRVNAKLDVELPLRDRSFVNDLKNCETVGELVDLIETEAEF